MLAAVLKDFNNLVLEEVPTPTPGPGEVLVRIKSCGFCATDYKAIKGIRRNVTFPLIPGHEPSGVIAAVGPGVTHFKEGDEVICQPSGYCGVCEACRMGNTHYCEHAYTTGGDGPEKRTMITVFALHGMNVARMIVMRRSRAFSIVRAAITAGTPHPFPTIMGMKDLPERPNPRK